MPLSLWHRQCIIFLIYIYQARYFPCLIITFLITGSINALQEASQMLRNQAIEDDYEYEIFSILSSARAWTSGILAGKRDSRRTLLWALARMSWWQKQVIKFLRFYRFAIGRAPNLFRKGNRTSFFDKNKSTMKLSECLWSENTRKNFKSNLEPVVVLVLESKRSLTWRRRQRERNRCDSCISSSYRKRSNVYADSFW